MEEIMRKVNSIKDIAEIVGVSPSTVSRVLNKKGRYSAETEKKINKVVEEYGFVYNMSAKSLKNSKTNTIGLIIPDITNDFFSAMALRIEKFFKRANYSVYICNSSDDPENECSYFSDLAANRVDGIICFSQMTKLPKNFESYRIPIVAIDRDPQCDMPIPCVYSDDYDGGYKATELLIKHGCSHILHIANPVKKLVPTKGYYKRTEGYKQALRDHNISFDDSDIIIPENSSDSAIFEAEAIINTLLYKKKKFDGIFASNDQYAFGLVYALQNHDIRVPEDVKVIGFDNSLYSMLIRPLISTVSRNTSKMTNEACQWLLDIINGEKKMSNDTIIVPTSVIERESTKDRSKH